MWKIRILTVGKLKEEHWRLAQEEFLKRLRPFALCEVVEVAAEPLGSTITAEEVMRREGERINKAVPASAVKIVMDRQGKMVDSLKFAEKLEDLGGAGQELCFVIGGTAGLAPEIVKSAQWALSLSPMTFTHEMARVFLLEQVYRSAMITHGKAYHY